MRPAHHSRQPITNGGVSTCGSVSATMDQAPRFCGDECLFKTAPQKAMKYWLEHYQRTYRDGQREPPPFHLFCPTANKG